MFTGKEEMDESYVGFWADQSKCLVNHLSRFAFRWSIFVMILSIASVVLTPIEMAFLDLHFDAMFFFNRITELIFLLDIVLNFHLTYQDVGSGKGLVMDKKMISRNYLRCWFWLDLSVVIPYDLLNWVEAGSGSSGGHIQVLKLVRLMRVVRLVRILKASKAFQKYYIDFAVNFNLMEGLKMLISTLFIIHVMACGLIYVSRFEGDDLDTHRWQEENGFQEYSARRLYCVAFYWATMTVTTIGYGDISLVTDTEKIYATVCMIIGATAYAYATGQLLTLIMDVNRETQFFKDELNVLNGLMGQSRLSSETQAQMRQYLLYTKNTRSEQNKKYVLKYLSPHLKSVLLVNMHANWLKKIPFFMKNLDGEFISAIAAVVHENAYAPKELIVSKDTPILHLHFMLQGIVLYGSHWLTKNHYFGEAIICQAASFHASTASSLGFCQTRSIRRNELIALLQQPRFRAVAKEAKKAAVRIRFRAVGASVMKQISQGAPITNIYGSFFTKQRAAYFQLLSGNRRSSLAVKTVEEIHQNKLTERLHADHTKYGSNLEHDLSGDDPHSQALRSLQSSLDNLQEEVDLKHRELASALGHRLDSMEKRLFSDLDDLKKALLRKQWV